MPLGPLRFGGFDPTLQHDGRLVDSTLQVKHTRQLEIESWSDVPELRALVGRGVTVIAPTYEGAPEERLGAVRDYALERYPFLDRGEVEWREPR